MKCAVYPPLAVVLILSLVNGASPPSDQPAVTAAGSTEEEATKSTKTAETRATSSPRSSSSSPSSPSSLSSSSSSSSDDGDHQQVLQHDDATAPSRRGSAENKKNDVNKKIGKVTITAKSRGKEPRGGDSSSMDRETKENAGKEEEPQRPSSSMHPDGKHIPEGEQHKKSETNRCWDYDLSVYQKGMICGPPLSYPCFDFGRCQPPPAGGGPTMYVYDYDCTLRDSGELSVSEEEVRDGRHLGSHWRKVGWVDGWAQVHC